MGFTRPFDVHEYAARVADVKRRMGAAGLDMLVCQDAANISWLTGLDGWTFHVPQAVIVHINENWPIWFGRAQDAGLARITTILSPDNISVYPEALLQHTQEHPFDALCALIRMRGWGKDRIGVEFDAPSYTARAHRHFISGLPDAKVSDSTGLVNRARLVKSPAEIRLMREAGLMATGVMSRVTELLRPGVPQYEICAEICRAQVAGIGGRHGDWTAMSPMMQAGEGTAVPHLTWSDEPLPQTGPVVLEIAAARRRYHVPLVRTFHLGAPPKPVSDLARVIVEGVDAALEAARPGATCEEVEAVWQKILNAHGYAKESRAGYSIGLAYPPDWAERSANLRPGDATVLEPGMCFHFQSGVWLERFGAAISEPFVVTPKGGEKLATAPRELIVID